MALSKRQKISADAVNLKIHMKLYLMIM